MTIQPPTPGEAHLSYRCSACEVNWWAHQTNHERCPMCGGSTVCTDEPASDDADLLYRIARSEMEKRDFYADFDRYYVGRDQDSRAA